MSKAGKSQLVYLLRILEYCGKLQAYLHGFTNQNEFFNKAEQLYFNSSLTLLVQIGEQSAKLDDTLKAKVPAVPWPMIKGFRNIVVHEYQYVDAEKVFQICTIHIPNYNKNWKSL